MYVEELFAIVYINEIELEGCLCYNNLDNILWMHLLVERKVKVTLPENESNNRFRLVCDIIIASKATEVMIWS